MSSIDLITMAVRNLFKRKMRTFLTTLGVVVGATSIVILISLGIAINIGFEQSISQRGDLATITVMNPSGNNNTYVDPKETEDIKAPTGKKLELNDELVNTLKKIKGVKVVTPTSTVDLQVKAGKYVGYFRVVGIDPLVMDNFSYKVAQGNLIKPGEPYSVVCGAIVNQNFYNPKSRSRVWTPINVDLMKEKIESSVDSGFAYGYENTDEYATEEEKAKRPKPFVLNVVGVLEPQGYDKDFSVFMDIREVLKLKIEQQKFEQQNYGGGSKQLKVKKIYETILVKCNDFRDVESISKIIKDMGYYPESAFRELQDKKDTSKSLQVFLGVVGIVALFIAAIGIANTMIMSIYERTREIGIMKVIGSSIKDIKRLFLLEASIIGFLGGVLGILFSYLISYILNNSNIQIFNMNNQENYYSYFDMGPTEPVKNLVSSIPLWLALSALLFSCVIGLISGYFPARRAMKLSAIEAIKSE